MLVTRVCGFKFGVTELDLGILNRILGVEMTPAEYGVICRYLQGVNHSAQQKVEGIMDMVCLLEGRKSQVISCGPEMRINPDLNVGNVGVMYHQLVLYPRSLETARFVGHTGDAPWFQFELELGRDSLGPWKNILELPSSAWAVKRPCGGRELIGYNSPAVSSGRVEVIYEGYLVN